MNMGNLGLAVIAGPALLASLLVPASHAAATSHPKSTPIVNEQWAGYSANPAKGYVRGEQASWGVPRITCPTSIFDGAPRAVVWVGEWGSIPDIEKKTSWLPQIGTSARCVGGKPKYELTWEMFTYVKNGGNGAQYGLDCPGSKLYRLCGNLKSVSPNDVVTAAVAFAGPYSNKAAVRQFNITLLDLTTGDEAVGYIKTNQPVALDDIATQGGVILEDNPTCHLTDFILGKCHSLGPNGLAEFAGGLTVGTATTYTGGSGGKPGLRYSRWIMTNDGHQLAKDGSLAIVDSTMNFTVTWERRT
jgi:hypothetical protein